MRAVSEVYHALEEGAERAQGLATAVGDEGGFAPEPALERGRAEAHRRRDRAGRLRAGPRHRDRARSGRQRVLRGRHVHAEGRGADSDRGGARRALCANGPTRYPIVSIEDGMAEDDWDGWRLLTDALGDQRPAGRRRPLRHQRRAACSAGIDEGRRQLDPRQGQPDRHADGDARRDRPRAPRPATRSVISHRSGETEDTTIADLAVATGAGQIKTGAPARSERVAKYNQLLRDRGGPGRAGDLPGLAAFPRARR